MAKEDNSVNVESDTWNVGKGFSATHILVPLINCQRYLDLCNRGVDDITDIHFVSQDIISKNRIFALDSFLRELQKLITNTKFTMDKTNLRNILKINISLNKTERDIEKTFLIVEDQRSGRSSYRINEKQYRECLNSLINSLENIKKPLNAKNLIFPSSGNIDLEELKREIMEFG